MPVETLYDLYRARGRLHVRCDWGRREGMRSVRECAFRCEPDLLTLMLTHGRRCELANLKGKMRCPQCGSWRVLVSWTLPGQGDSAALRADIG
jgi:hypothetical protein